MKKIIGILALVAMGIIAQSCGSGEKCPAYSQAPASNEVVNS